MENSKKMNDFSTGEPQVLRKAEIARILNTVKQAPFNADNSKNSENKSFKKRSLLDIALNSAKDDNSEVAIDKDIDQTKENLQNENTSPENNETEKIESEMLPDEVEVDTIDDLKTPLVEDVLPEQQITKIKEKDEIKDEQLQEITEDDIEIIEPGNIKLEEKPIEKIRDKIKSKTGLKEAFILKEILDRKYD